MNHQVKMRKRPRRSKLRWGFAFAGVWAGALAAVLLLSALPAGEGESRGYISLRYRGQSQRAAGTGITVAQLLESMGLELDEGDVVSPSLNSIVSEGMEITVTNYRQRQEDFTLALLPETEYVLDDTLPWGVEKVLQPGVPGELRCTATVDYVDGVETHREIGEKTLLSEVVPTIIAIGIREGEAPLAESGCIQLADGQMLNYKKAVTAEATAFSASDGGGALPAQEGTVLVDGAFIPAGSRLYISGADGSWNYGIAQAVDSGTVAGNRIDLFFGDKEAAQFGKKECIVYFLG